MQKSDRLVRFLLAVAVSSVIPILVSNAMAIRKERVLYAFTGGSDGYFPSAGLILDKAGNLYGTTRQGGRYGSGTVFELTPSTNGKWIKTVLHHFNSRDGSFPSASLVSDAAGNIYGTTFYGSIYNQGVVFKLTPGANGEWTFTVLHRFNHKDGSGPFGLTFDTAGNLYGPTAFGGEHGLGVVFRLAPGTSGKWIETVLYSFNGKDGANPEGGVVFDGVGNLYGATLGGGANYYGNVFKLTPLSNGKWYEETLHSFNVTDGSWPLAGVILDAKGRVYGTTSEGGLHGAGLVFKLTRGFNGRWSESVLYTFQVTYHDGQMPEATLAFDTTGALYGTTSQAGTVFKLTYHRSGNWTEAIVHEFRSPAGGEQPQAGVIFDSAGNLYGTTYYGGSNNINCRPLGCGVVFEIMP